MMKCVPFKKFEISSNCGILSARKPQCLISNGKALLYSSHACVGYSLVNSLNITPLLKKLKLKLSLTISFEFTMLQFQRLYMILLESAPH
jgi:hypothetical protein